MALPYSTAKGNGALLELQKVLAKFDCQSFGTMIDNEREIMMVQFKWRGQAVSLEFSWRGYAEAWLKENPYNYTRMRLTKEEHNQRALKIAQAAACSGLRDWVKGQIVAYECGFMSFATSFMPHMLLPDGRRVMDIVKEKKILMLPDESNE